MSVHHHQGQEQSAIRTDLGAVFVSLELSRRTWLLTSLSPGVGEKMSKHAVQAGDVAGLLQRFAEFKRRAEARTGREFPIIVIQEAGLDGFWIHRVLESEGIESHVVDAASILTSPATAGEDRPDRRRDAVAHAHGLQARRAQGMLDGQAAIA
jgi:transposase